MARKSIAWILDFTSKLPNEEEQIKCLRANENESIKTVLRFALDPNIKWALPETDPPYAPCEFPHQENNLYMESRRLYLFLEGGNNNLNQVKRERMFIDLLENVDPADAKLLLAAKNKELPFPNIKPETVQKAYPGLF